MTDTIIERCEAKGLRMTEQRRTIATVLEEAHDHPDVEELYARASGVDPNISLATVYRTVKLFEEAGIQDPTNLESQIFMRSVDGFTCGFPTPLAYDGRTAMLALEMNGEPLPINHGFPARIVVAGLYGYVSATKWIEQISITEWDGVDGFWIPRGWSKEGPVKTQSRIDVPRTGSRVDPGPVTVAGIAWSPTIGIDRVELSFDQGESWQLAELANTENDEAWVQWKYDWTATPGEYLVGVRATDKSGFTQSPIPVAPAPNGAEGYHVSRIVVS